MVRRRAAFVAIFVFHVPFPVIMLGGGADRLVGGRVRPGCSTPA